MRACRNGGGRLLPGARSGEGAARNVIDSALMVPIGQAKIPELRGQKVMVSRGGKATPVSVDIGLPVTPPCKVTKGLQPGDTVLMHGHHAGAAWYRCR